MPVTADRRREINRENARKSTGPRTDEGKARSRGNALRHGLRAEALALPHEDPAAVLERSYAWNDHYQPGSPAAQHLVNQCVQATLLADRVHRYHVAAVSAQVVEAQEAWDAVREDEVDVLTALLAKEPAEAVAGLRRTGLGCRWMVGRWEELGRMLDDRGCWTDYERNEAVRMLGLRPEPHHVKGQPDAWLTRLYNLLCQPERSKTAVEEMFAPGRMPAPLRASYRPDALPDPDTCRRALRATVDDQVALLNEAEHRSRNENDTPDRDAAADRVFLLPDAPSARLFLRYHAEARMAFHRAYGSLLKSMEVDEPAPAPVDPPGTPEESPESQDNGQPVASTPLVRPSRTGPRNLPERSHHPRPETTPHFVVNGPEEPVSTTDTG